MKQASKLVKHFSVTGRISASGNRKLAAYLKAEKEHIEKLNLKNKVAVDVGAGEGSDMVVLARTAALVIGIEFSPVCIQKARANLSAFGNVQLLEGDAHNIPLPENLAHLAVCMYNTLGNSENPKKVLEEMARIVKADGMLLLSLFSESYPLEDQIKLYEANNLRVSDVIRYKDGSRKVLIDSGFFSIVFSQARIENLIKTVALCGFRRIEISEIGVMYEIKVEN